MGYRKKSHLTCISKLFYHMLLLSIVTKHHLVEFGGPQFLKSLKHTNQADMLNDGHLCVECMTRNEKKTNDMFIYCYTYVLDYNNTKSYKERMQHVDYFDVLLLK